MYMYFASPAWRTSL